MNTTKTGNYFNKQKTKNKQYIKINGGNMKFKTTSKQIKNNYFTIISIGYCGLQSLLSYENPIAYNKGVYGWNFDLYDFDGVAICTGYRLAPSKNSKNDYSIVKKYEELSKGKTQEEKRKLITQFINEMRIEK